ncbi:MAG: hypothetical protein WAV50_03680 [Minisyncoccia bacterium]
MQGSLNKIPKSRKNKLEDDEAPVGKKQYPAKKSKKEAQEIKRTVGGAPHLETVSPTKETVPTETDAGVDTSSFQNPYLTDENRSNLIQTDLDSLNLASGDAGEVAPAPSEPVIQVETKSATPWTPPTAPVLGREMHRAAVPVEEEPATQVETEIDARTRDIEAEEQSAIDTRIKFARMADIPTLTDVVEPKQKRRFEVGEPQYLANPEPQGEPEYAVWRRGEPRDISLSSLGEPVTPIEAEGTPLEEKKKFREFMTGAKERLHAERMKEYTAQRSVELDEKGKGYGPKAEKLIRAIGKTYNKLGWKSQIAVGVSLGIGSVAVSGVSMPLAFLFGAGLGVQRLAGMSSMFLKMEKYLQDHKGANIGMGPLRIREERIKEAAAFGAIAYTALMGVAIGEAVTLASETEAAHAVQKWLGGVLGHTVPATPEAPVSHNSVPSQATSGRIIPPPATPEAPPVAPAPTAEIPSVHASAPEAPTAATNAGEVPVSAPIAEVPPVAAEAPVPAVAPEIPSAATSIEVKATPGKGYEYMMKRLWEQLHENNVELPANANPESDLARLLAADKDSIDKVVHEIAADPKHQFFRADGSSVRIDADTQMTIGARGELHLSGEKYDYRIAPPQAPVTPALHPEAPSSSVPTPPVESIPHIDLVPPEPVGTVDLISTPSEVLVPGPETVISNQFGIAVHINEAHLYADPSDQNFFVYGGSQEEKVKTMTEYLNKHPFKVVYAEDSAGHRVPWFRSSEGVVTQGPPMQTKGFLGMFSSFLKPPTPDDFGKIIK